MCVCICGTLYFLPVCFTTCLVLLCDMISCSHSMYNAYPKLYVTCLSAFFPLPLQPRVSIHSLALECFIWPHIRPISARFMTSGVGLFHWIPRRDKIHGCCVWYLLCFQIWELRHCRRVRGVVRRNPLYFHQPTSFSPLYIHQLKKAKKKKKKKTNKPWATFITPSLNYSIVIKQHTFNHSLC